MLSPCQSISSLSSAPHPNAPAPHRTASLSVQSSAHVISAKGPAVITSAAAAAAQLSLPPAVAVPRRAARVVSCPQLRRRAAHVESSRVRSRGAASHSTGFGAARLGFRTSDQIRGVALHRHRVAHAHSTVLYSSVVQNSSRKKSNYWIGPLHTPLLYTTLQCSTVQEIADERRLEIEPPPPRNRIASQLLLQLQHESISATKQQ